jgi:hypothetical protein
MADNVDVTAGSGTTIHADEYTHGTLGSGKTQLVKLVNGTLDSDTAIVVDIGGKANALRICPANDITDATYIGDIKFGESLPAGTNGIGKLTANSGVDIGDVDVTSCDGIAAEAAALGNGILIQGDDGTDRKNINVDATTGDVQVDVTNTITETNSAAILADTANMDTNLGTIAGAVTGTEMQVDIVADGVGLATAANQTTANGSLADIETNTDFGAVTGGGVEATALRVTLANDSTGVISIDDGGNTITVDGTVDTELTTDDLDTGAGSDTRAVVGLVGSANGGGALIPGSATDGLLVNLGTNNDVTLATLPDTAASDLATISGDTTSIDGKITACNTGAVTRSDWLPQPGMR